MARFSIPLSAQIVGLMLAGLVVAQAVTLFLTLLAPPAPAPEYSLRDVAAALNGEKVQTRGARPLVRSFRSDPPSLASAGWLVSERSRRELAELLRTDEANVRLLFYSPLPFAGTGAGGRLAQGSGPLWLPHRQGWASGMTDVAPTTGPAEVRFLMQRRMPMGAPPSGGGWRGGGPFGPWSEPSPNPPGRFPAPSQLPAPSPSPGPGPSPAPSQSPAPRAPPASSPSPSPQAGGTAPAAPSGAPGAGPAPGAGASPSSGAPNSAAQGQGGSSNGGQGGGAGAAQASSAGGNKGGSANAGASGGGQGGQAQAGAPGGGQGGLGQGGQGQGGQGQGGQGQGGQGQGQIGGGPGQGVGGANGPGGAAPSGQVTGVGGPASTAAASPSVGIPNVGSPQTPDGPAHTSTVERREALAARAELSPRPNVLAPQGQPGSADIGVIVPAPLAAAQAGDASGWIVGTPQQTARGLFGLSPSPFVQGDFVAAQQIAPHRWATVAPKPEPFPNAWQQRVIWWFLTAFAVVGPLGYLFARRLAQPIDRFAAAAERIGRDPSAPLAPLTGPAEIGRAAKAFNQMHSRLKRFVEDRTGMVGAISHDLRTPLARMRFRLERASPEVREDMLSDIRQMEEMISSVLVFIRDASEPAVRERIDLRSLVECVVDDAAMLGGEAALDPGEPISVDVDALGVQRVLTNLIDNALKYGERADVRLYRDGAEAVAEVTDDGPGLPPEELERVFLPFYRADHARGMNKGGIGLGLAVSRSIARAHGGDVLLASNDRGLRVQLRLPIASQAA